MSNRQNQENIAIFRISRGGGGFKREQKKNKSQPDFNSRVFKADVWGVRRSVSRVLYRRPELGRLRRRRWPFIWGGRYRPPLATDPGGKAGKQTIATSTWSCSRWGLPCRRRCRRRGALLPHPFTLAVIIPAARAAWTVRRFAFCGTFPEVTPAGRYPASCFRGARTFLSTEWGAAIRPSDSINNDALQRKFQEERTLVQKLTSVSRLSAIRSVISSLVPSAGVPIALG